MWDKLDEEAMISRAALEQTHTQHRHELHRQAFAARGSQVVRTDRTPVSLF